MKGGPQLRAARSGLGERGVGGSQATSDGGKHTRAGGHRGGPGVAVAGGECGAFDCPQTRNGRVPMGVPARAQEHSEVPARACLRVQPRGPDAVATGLRTPRRRQGQSSTDSSSLESVASAPLWALERLQRARRSLQAQSRLWWKSEAGLLQAQCPLMTFSETRWNEPFCTQFVTFSRC